MRHRSKPASRSPRRPWFSPRELAPQSIPFALIVRCLVALVARRHTTALGPGLLATDPSLTSRPLRASAAALATFSASVWSAPGLRYASTVSVIWTTGSRAVGAVAAPGSSSRAARATDPRARPESSRGRQGRPPRAEGSIGHTRTGCVGGSGARRGEVAERAASRSTGSGGIVLPGGLPAFALVAVTRRRLLLQALPGFLVAARVDSLPRVAGVALARPTERLAHALLVQLSCLVVGDHVLDSSLAAGAPTAHAAVFPASVPGRLKGKGTYPEGARLRCSPSPTRPPRPS